MNDLMDRQDDLIIDMALDKWKNACNKAEELAFVEDTEYDSHIKRTEKDILFLINKQVPRAHTNAKVKRFISALPKVAAILLVVSLVATSTAVAFVQEIREAIFKWLFQNQEAYTEISTQPNMQVPEEWEGDFFPTYIPTGFSVAIVLSHGDANHVEFIDNSGDYFAFSERLADSTTQLDTEDAQIITVDINGVQAQCAISEKYVNVYWVESEKLLTIRCSDNLEIAFAIARSIKPI